MIGDIVKVLLYQICANLIKDVLDGHRVPEHAKEEGLQEHRHVIEVCVTDGHEVIGLVSEDIAIRENLRVSRKQARYIKNGPLPRFPSRGRDVVVEEREIVDRVY